MLAKKVVAHRIGRLIGRRLAEGPAALEMGTFSFTFEDERMPVSAELEVDASPETRVSCCDRVDIS